MDSVVVGRHIGGVTLNPLEYLLDGDGELMEFRSERDARAYLKEHGSSDEDMLFMVFDRADDGGPGPSDGSEGR